MDVNGETSGVDTSRALPSSGSPSSIALDRKDSGTRLLASSRSRTVLAERGPVTLRSAYPPYGHRSPGAEPGRPGFNGEYLEFTGVQLLGSHRAYNPLLMRFHNPDRLSPFGQGGLNPYGYCLGDPVNRVDPTGRIPWWAGAVAGVAATMLVAPLAAIALPSVGVLATQVTYSAAVVGGVAGFVSVGTGVGATLPGAGRVRETLEWVSFASSIVAGVAAGVAARGAAARLLPKKPRRVSNASHSSRASTGSLEMPGDHVMLPIFGSDPVEIRLTHAVNSAYEKTEELRLLARHAQGPLPRMFAKNQLRNAMNMEHFARQDWANYLKVLPPDFESVIYRADVLPKYDDVVVTVSDIRGG